MHTLPQEPIDIELQQSLFSWLSTDAFQGHPTKDDLHIAQKMNDLQQEDAETIQTLFSWLSPDAFHGNPTEADLTIAEKIKQTEQGMH